MPFARHLATAFAVMLASSAQLAAQNTPRTAPANDEPASVSTAITAAQSPVTDVSAQPASFAPTEANARVGVRTMKSSTPVPFEPEPEHLRHSVVLMIVGGAILVVGAAVGGQPGTIIMIGGGVVGIVGLVRYLQHP